MQMGNNHSWAQGGDGPGIPGLNFVAYVVHPTPWNPGLCSTPPTWNFWPCPPVEIIGQNFHHMKKNPLYQVIWNVLDICTRAQVIVQVPYQELTFEVLSYPNANTTQLIHVLYLQSLQLLPEYQTRKIQHYIVRLKKVVALFMVDFLKTTTTYVEYPND